MLPQNTCTTEKFSIKCNPERSYCPPNHAIKATVIWEPENQCRIFDVGRSHARMINFQKRYFIETVENNATSSDHKHMPHRYSSRFPKHLYDESALSRFEVLTKPLYKCNEDHPYYAYQDILYSIEKALTLCREYGDPTLIIHT